jgi:DNA modification methylase
LIDLRLGDCLEILPTIPSGSVSAVVTDPPYGEDMGIAGDSSPWEAGDLLGRALAAAEPALKRNAHVAVFWPLRTLDVCLDVVRSVGLTYRRTLAMYLPSGAARPYLGWLPRTQAIVLAQKYLPKPPREFHRDLAEYVSVAIERSGLGRTAIAKELGCDSRLVMMWSRVDDPQWNLPTARFYRHLKTILDLDERFDVLLERESKHEAESRDFEYRHDFYFVDEKSGRMLHPCQKPLSVVRHIVKCLAAEGEVVLDPFAGSATTLVACAMTGRHGIGIEIDPDYVEMGHRRLRAAETPLFPALKDSTPCVASLF